MTAAELQDWLRAGGGPLTLDTNVVYQHRRLLGLSDQLNALKARQIATQTRLYVSAVVHAEKLHDLRQAFGHRYNHDLILAGMRSKGIEVKDFTERHAEHLAEILGQRYAGSKDWHTFKRTLYLRRLGLPKDLWTQAPATGQNCGATVDWLIAAQADCERWLLITEDEGAEFDGVRRVGLAPLEGALAQLVSTA